MAGRFTSMMADEDAQRFAELVKRIPGYMRLVKQILADPDVPTKSKAFLSVGGAYAISPIDLIPGIIPVAGQLDDAYALLFGLRKAITSMPPVLAEQHLSTAGVTLEEIDNDIALVVSIAKRLGRMVINVGARIGRAGKATLRFAGEALRRGQ